MATIKRFEDIQAWKSARELSKKIGTIIDEGRFKKSFRLISQIEGSSGFIMDNIAEGFERGTRGEFIQFLGYSKGSCGEFRSRLYRALDRNYLGQKEFDELYQLGINIGGMLHKFIEYFLRTEVKGQRMKTSNLKP